MIMMLKAPPAPRRPARDIWTEAWRTWRMATAPNTPPDAVERLREIMEALGVKTDHQAATHPSIWGAEQARLSADIRAIYQFVAEDLKDEGPDYRWNLPPEHLDGFPSIREIHARVRSGKRSVTALRWFPRLFERPLVLP